MGRATSSSDLVKKAAVLYFAFLFALFALSYAYLAFFHGTPFLFNTVIHENGRLTLFQTIFTFDHFLGQWPMIVLFSFFLTGVFLLFNRQPPRQSCQAASKASLLIFVVAALLAIIFFASVNNVGLPETLRILSEAKENDTISSWGGNWNMMVLSNIILSFIAIGFAAGLSVFSGFSKPRIGRSGLAYIIISALLFISLCIVFRTDMAAFSNPRWLAHSVREVLTNTLITIPLVLISLQLIAGKDKAAAGNPDRIGRSGCMTVLRRLASNAIFIIVPLFIAALLLGYNVFAVLGHDVGDLAQKPSFAHGDRLSVPYLVASHFFEHTLDYLFILIASIALYYLSLSFSDRRHYAPSIKRGR